MTEDDFTPSTETVRARYHLATLPDTVSQDIIERSRPRANAEFDRWLKQLKAELRSEIEAERGSSGAPSEVDGEWEYGWRSFFSNGEEFEWLATLSREDAEQQIKDYQEEEDQKFGADGAEGKLTYGLWRRRKAAAGPWERVEENPHGES